MSISAVGISTYWFIWLMAVHWPLSAQFWSLKRRCAEVALWGIMWNILTDIDLGYSLTSPTWLWARKPFRESYSTYAAVFSSGPYTYHLRPRQQGILLSPWLSVITYLKGNLDLRGKDLVIIHLCAYSVSSTNSKLQKVMRFVIGSGALTRPVFVWMNITKFWCYNKPAPARLLHWSR